MECFFCCKSSSPKTTQSESDKENKSLKSTNKEQDRNNNRDTGKVPKESFYGEKKKERVAHVSKQAPPQKQIKEGEYTLKGRIFRENKFREMY